MRNRLVLKLQKPDNGKNYNKAVIKSNTIKTFQKTHGYDNIRTHAVKN